MVEFYKKTEEGKYVEANDDVEQLFKQRSDKIVAEKLRKERERTKAEIHRELDDEMRRDISETIMAEAEEKIKAKYAGKLAASEKKAQELDTKLRKKTIAAEYGFKPEMEQFLGDGDDDSMRAKADTLKKEFDERNGTPTVDKQSNPTLSKIQSATGIQVTV